MPEGNQRLDRAFGEHLRRGKHLPHPFAFYLVAAWQALPAIDAFRAGAIDPHRSLVVLCCLFAMIFALGGILVRRRPLTALLGSVAALSGRYALQAWLEGSWAKGWLGYALFGTIFLLAIPLEIHRRRRYP